MRIVQPAKVGDIIGNIKLVALIDKGGMGEIWTGFHEDLQVVVVVKLPLFNTEEAIERMLTEARAQWKLAKRKIKHIVTIHNVGRKPRPHIVMDLIQGKKLETILVANAHLLQDDFYQLQLMIMIRKVVKTLQLAHDFEEDGEKKPIIHRDIKPANILIEELAHGVFEPWTIDWGIARIGFHAEQTNDSSVMGSPLYISPEQSGDPENITPKTDVYSVGATIFHMVTNSIIYDDIHLVNDPSKNIKMDSPMGAIIKVGKWWEQTPEATVRFSKRIQKVPPWARNMVEGCMRINPEERISMLELDKKLEAAISYLSQQVARIHGSVTGPVFTVLPPAKAAADTVVEIAEADVADTEFDEPETEPVPAAEPKAKKSRFTLFASLALILLVAVIMGLAVLISKNDPSGPENSEPKPKAKVQQMFVSRAVVDTPMRPKSMRLKPMRPEPVRPKPVVAPRPVVNLEFGPDGALMPPSMGDVMPSDEYIARYYKQQDAWCRATDPKRALYKHNKSHHSKCIRDRIRELWRKGAVGTAALLADELRPHFCVWVYLKHNQDVRNECGKHIVSLRKKLFKAKFNDRLVKRKEIRNAIRRRVIARVKAMWAAKRKAREERKKRRRGM